MNSEIKNNIGTTKNRRVKMEVLDQLFGKKTDEKVSVDTNTQVDQENAEKIDVEKNEAENTVVEQAPEDENLTNCEKCDLDKDTCGGCEDIEVPETAEVISIEEVEEEYTKYTSHDAVVEILSVLDSTPSTDFELVNLKSRLYGIISKVV